MKQKLFLTTILLAAALQPASLAVARQHRATQLGNPATRFAPPIRTVEDLRSRFNDPKLRPDIASILEQAGWKGDLNDLYRAAATGEVSEVEIPNGAIMPFMSSRKNGRPITLREVLWAGKEPVDAYAFEFTSRGRFYQCVTPKPCSNFYVEDLGAPGLAIECTAPGETPTSRAAELGLKVSNTGDGIEPKTTVSLALPAEVVFVRATEGGAFAGGKVGWTLLDLEPGETREVRALVTMGQPGARKVAATAAGSLAPQVQTMCETRVVGIPAILIDAVDLDDPVEAGKEVTYDIKITSQGSVACTNLRLVCTLPDQEEFVSGSGPTEVQADGKKVTTKPLPTFPAKDVVTWRVVVKALSPGDVRFQVNVHAEEFLDPIFEEESTLLYQ